MGDAFGFYLGIGLVCSAWAAIAAFLSHIWPPIVWLALPAVIWIASFLFLLGIVAPGIRIYQALRRWRA